MSFRSICLAFWVSSSWVAFGCSGPSGGDGDTPLYRLQIGGRAVFPSGEIPPVPGTVLSSFYGLQDPSEYDRCKPSLGGYVGEYREGGVTFGVETSELSADRFVGALAVWTVRTAEELSRDFETDPPRRRFAIGDRYGETAMHSQGPCDPPDPGGATCFQGRFTETIVLTSTISEACP